MIGPQANAPIHPVCDHQFSGGGVHTDPSGEDRIVPGQGTLLLTFLRTQPRNLLVYLGFHPVRRSCRTTFVTGLRALADTPGTYNNLATPGW